MSGGEETRTNKTDLHPIEASHLHARRERVFLIFAGIFLGTLTMLNILGVTRFIHLGTIERAGAMDWTFAIAVGVLPYPITFLCTDFISEFYGRKRARAVVLTGLLLNIWVMLILWLGGVLPGFESVDPTTGEILKDDAGRLPVFFEVRTLAFGAVIASMIAYLAAQMCDVYIFHFWKWLTKGKHLWLRNCGSTTVSQFIDTMLVIYITWYVGGLAGVIDKDQPLHAQLWILIATGYLFKFVVALVDTIPFYIGSHYLARYLRIDPRVEHQADAEEAVLSQAM